MLAAIALVICGASVAGWRLRESRTPPLAPLAAKRLAEQALGFRLSRVPPVNSSNAANLEASYAGRQGRRAATLLVFDGPRAVRQVLGTVATQRSDPVVVLSVRNVVVIYSDAGGPGPPVALARALRG